jgi:hypothetical protein
VETTWTSIGASPVQLGESTQWIRIRAANANNPLLLLVQMGPGLPMINEVPAFGRALSLEDDFTVVYWDQRGVRPLAAVRGRHPRARAWRR